MALTIGSQIGSYEIVAPLGAGGMGEVYRARDVKLGREVALKVLPPSFTEDPERVARFQREAQILASLNHPNIAAIYGLEQAEATPFLVLELVEGETLDARVKATRSGLPFEEAMNIARQIANALEAAHEKGIVHRDLKPANVAVTGDGLVKVLDFGLAKAMERGPAGELSQSPTITFAATQAGVILGTAAYMSPEQAKGRIADKRTDVWAFGCVLFEMLTGRRAFEGEDITETIAAIVRGEPDWSALPTAVPDQIRLLIRRCLDKDRRTRVSDIGVARFLMTETIATPPAVAELPAAKTTPPASRAAIVGTLAGLIVGMVVTGVLAWTFLRQPAATPRQPARFPLVPAAAQALVLQSGDRNIAIDPDGTFIVYRGATQGPQLFVRALSDLNARPLGGPSDADPRSPFISPDGRWVGFFSGQEIKKVLIAGGPAITVCRLPGPPRGASWGSDGTIVFGTANAANGLMTVSAGGGEPKVLIKPEGSASTLFGFPSVLPGGNAVLFTIGAPGASTEVVNLAQIAVLNRKTGEWKVLVRGGSQPQYVNGYLVYGSAGTLRALPFDLDHLTTSGDPIPVVEQVLSMANGAVNFAVSRDGSLVYVPATAGNVSATPRSLVWVTREGREEPLKLPPRPYESVRLSPDGTRLAVGIRDGQRDIWTGDVARPPLTRLTFDPTTDQAPVWMPDGKRIVWSSQRGNGTPNIYMQSADGTGPVQQLSANTHPTFPTSVSPDGTKIVVWENSPATRQDIALIEISAAAEKQPPLVPLVHSPAVEVGADVSPDGRWLAYESDESGRPEVYVRPFPNVDGGRWQVSVAGGTRPIWARSGRELFYLDGSGLLTAVAVSTTGSTFTAGNPAKVLDTKYYPGFTELGLDLRGYDVSPDGKRFLMLKDPSAESTPSAPPASMIVVLNWLEELKARIPAK